MTEIPEVYEMHLWCFELQRKHKIDRFETKKIHVGHKQTLTDDGKRIKIVEN